MCALLGALDRVPTRISCALHAYYHSGYGAGQNRRNAKTLPEENRREETNLMKRGTIIVEFMLLVTGIMLIGITAANQINKHIEKKIKAEHEQTEGKRK